MRASARDNNVGRRANSAAGGAYLRHFPFSVIRQCFREHTHTGIPATFYLHPWELDPEQPRLPVGWITRARHYGGLSRTRPRMEQLLAGFRFTGAAQCLKLQVPAKGVERWGLESGGLTVVVDEYSGPASEWDGVLFAPPVAGRIFISTVGNRSSSACSATRGFRIWPRVIMHRAFPAFCRWSACGAVYSATISCGMPFLNYGGPLGSDNAVRALGGRADEIARRDDVSLLELRSRRQLPLAMPVSHRKITVLLDLPATSAELWKGLPAKVRNQVRRPQKEGITVSFGREQCAPFFSVFAQHMRELGTPTQPRRLFDTIADQFGDAVWFACAYHRNRPVAAGCAFRWDRELEE